MNYFAYRTDLDLTQMRLHCPGAVFLGTAKLDGYRLCFPRWSVIRNTAIVSIERAVGAEVWGILYQLSDADLQRADDREGYDKTRARALNQHNRTTVRVRTADNHVTVAQTYVAVPAGKAGQPSVHYVGYLVGAAADVGLPRSHLVALAQHIAVEASAAAA